MKQRSNLYRKEQDIIKLLSKNVFVVLGTILVLISLYNLLQMSSLNNLFEQKDIEAKENARPAELKLIIIKDSNCNNCFDISTIVDSIKNNNVKINDEETLDLKSNKAQALINKYGIEKIPTTILSGEIDKINFDNLEKRENILLFTKLTPPYTNTQNNQIVGIVSATILKDSSCDKCADMSSILTALKGSGVTIVSERVIEKDSKDGKELINKYSLEKIPTLIISKELSYYGLDQNWNSLGTIEKDGTYITRTPNPPYLNLITNKVEGLVSVTYLSDNSCSDCYDPQELHKPVLQNMGLVFSEEKIDISSDLGKQLIEDYSIEKIPTIIIKGDADKYPILAQAWNDVGTVESDGTYVFRLVEFAQKPYKDLNTNEVINNNPLIEP